MPAKSKAQQRSAGMALAAKRGEMDPSELQGAAKSMYDSMTKDELEDFAETSHEGLPDEVEESRRLRILRKAIRTEVKKVLKEDMDVTLPRYVDKGDIMDFVRSAEQLRAGAEKNEGVLKDIFEKHLGSRWEKKFYGIIEDMDNLLMDL